MIPRISSEQKMCGGVVMSGGKVKTGAGIRQVFKGIAAGFIICFLVIFLGAGMLQKGNMGDRYITPLLTFSVFLASLIGCIIAGKGGKGRQRTYAAVPGIILSMMILIGRWIGRHSAHDLPLALLLAACAAVPALLIGLRHPRKRRE